MRAGGAIYAFDFSRIEIPTVSQVLIDYVIQLCFACMDMGTAPSPKLSKKQKAIWRKMAASTTVRQTRDRIVSVTTAGEARRHGASSNGASSVPPGYPRWPSSDDENSVQIVNLREETRRQLREDPDAWLAARIAESVTAHDASSVGVSSVPSGYPSPPPPSQPSPPEYQSPPPPPPQPPLPPPTLEPGEEDDNGSLHQGWATSWL